MKFEVSSKMLSLKDSFLFYMLTDLVSIAKSVSVLRGLLSEKITIVIKTDLKLYQNGDFWLTEINVILG